MGTNPRREWGHVACHTGKHEHVDPPQQDHTHLSLFELFIEVALFATSRESIHTDSKEISNTDLDLTD
jgi:hypothetical protein